MPQPQARPAVATAPAVVTKAVMRAADRLDVPNRVLATVLGVSEATVSRMGQGNYQLSPATKPFELGVLFVRLFRNLDALTSGDTNSAREWLRGENTALGAAPLALITSISGLVNVVAYLDARRALS